MEQAEPTDFSWRSSGKPRPVPRGNVLTEALLPSTSVLPTIEYPYGRRTIRVNNLPAAIVQDNIKQKIAEKKGPRNLLPNPPSANVQLQHGVLPTRKTERAK